MQVLQADDTTRCHRRLLLGQFLNGRREVFDPRARRLPGHLALLFLGHGFLLRRAAEAPRGGFSIRAPALAHAYRRLTLLRNRGRAQEHPGREHWWPSPPYPQQGRGAPGTTWRRFGG